MSFGQRLLEAERSAPRPTRRCMASIGMATPPDDEIHGRQLLEVADAALHYTRRNGEDYCTHAGDVDTWDRARRRRSAPGPRWDDPH